MTEGLPGPVVDPGQIDLIWDLMGAAYEGPVFGQGVAFNQVPPAGWQTRMQSTEIALQAAPHIYDMLEQGVPEWSNTEKLRKMNDVLAKTVAFTAGLVAGEVTDNSILTQIVVGVDGMYIGNDLTDEDDGLMNRAIRSRYSDIPFTLDPEDYRGRQRLQILETMDQTVTSFAGDDAETILPFFGRVVLANEAAVKRLSSEYFGLLDDGDDAGAFLERHAIDIANRTAADAGVQSVAASIYRALQVQRQDLPSVSETHRHPRIRKLAQYSNVAARVADNFGDYEKDERNRVINEFNHPNPQLIGRLCILGGITTRRRIAMIKDSYQAFHDANNKGDREGCNEAGKTITDQFFGTVRTEFERTEGRTESKLCVPPDYGNCLIAYKRVVEISHVNMRGDEAMATGH